MHKPKCVEFVSVRKSFGRDQHQAGAMPEVSLTLARGECLSLLGSNGSGKSTVLRIAGGLVLPDGGQLRVFGGHPGRDGRIRARIAASFEGGRALYGRLTPEENARYFCRLKGRDQRAAMAMFDLLCERFSISLFKDVPVQTLSRGTQQKVSVICALAGNEALWLLDEPTLGLDKESAIVLADLVTEHLLGNGAALVATHDEQFASRIGCVVRMADFSTAPSGATCGVRDASCLDQQLLANARSEQLRKKPGAARPGRRQIFCCW